MTPPLALIVHLHAKSTARDALLDAIRKNAASSMQEPGCLYFHAVEDEDDSDRFTLYELYRDEAAIEFHRSTAHYRRWRKSAASCLDPDDGQVTQVGRLAFPWVAVSTEGVVILRPAELPRVNRSKGVHTTYLVAQHVGSTRFMNGVTVFAPGTGLKTHCHNCEESVVVLEGMALFDYNDETAELSVGDATWVPAGTWHRFRNAGKNTLRILWTYGSDSPTRTFEHTRRDNLDSTTSPVSAHQIVLIQGDGIGPELVDAAAEVLDVLQSRSPGLRLEVERVGAGARHYLETGVNISAEALALCRAADAILKGPAGLPDVRRPDGTEAGSLGGVLRSGLDVYANVRPISCGLGLTAHCLRGEPASIT